MRRRIREQEAVLNEPGDEVWPRIAPLLDDAVAALRAQERQAILLRFFEGKSLREVGQAIGSSEEAAKKRVSRALEKLRTYFGRRGATASVAVLSSAMAARCAEAAPAMLAKTVTAAALAKGGRAGAATFILVKGALKAMAWTKTQMTAATALILGLAAVSVLQHQAQNKLRETDTALRQQIAGVQAENERLSRKQVERAPRMPAPQFQAVAAPPVTPPSAEATNLYGRLYEKLRDATFKLTPEQTRTYLQAAGTNASSLLAAFRTSQDVSLLHEAMQRFPEDPQVAFEAAFDNTLPSEERRKWLDAFEKAAPENALANYLLALDHLNAGRTDQGLQEVQAAAGKGFEDYTVSRSVDDNEAFLAAGYPTADAKVLSTSQLLLPQLAQMKQLGQDLVQIAGSYTQMGDAASARAVLQMTDQLGQRYATPAAGEPEVSQLVGIVIQQMALKSMDPTAAYGETGQTVQSRLDQLAQQRSAVSQLGEQASNLMPSLSDEDWIIYKDRWLIFGEANAQQWVVNRYGGQGITSR